MNISVKDPNFKSTAAIECDICPHHCSLSPGNRGICRVRANIDGKIQALSYNKVCSVANDPVEKKPLFHFYPGERILSIGTLGCNLKCKNCQNFTISQLENESFGVKDLKIGDLLELAIEFQSRMVAFTYTEPLVTFEYVLEASKLLKANDVKPVIVSAGFINQDKLKQLIPYISGANIDLKSIRDEFYRENCAGTLAPVLDTLRTLYNSGVHLEITNLLIPGKNDSPEEIKQLSEFIVNELGDEVPLHFSAFFPVYKLNNISPTKPESIVNACKIAGKVGLKYVYGGNVSLPGYEDTFCPQCGELLIKRDRFQVIENHLNEGCCPTCECHIYGVF